VVILVILKIFLHLEFSCLKIGQGWQDCMVFGFFPWPSSSRCLIASGLDGLDESKVKLTLVKLTRYQGRANRRYIVISNEDLKRNDLLELDEILVVFRKELGKY
jgi:hypothetical protein